jgi:hypothetical protein
MNHAWFETRFALLTMTTFVAPTHLVFLRSGPSGTRLEGRIAPIRVLPPMGEDL